MNKENFNIWNGIYQNFGDVPKTGSGFDSAKWIDVSKNNLNNINIRNADNQTLRLNTTPLHLAAAMLYTPERALSILDFGGGLGLTYTELAGSISPSQKIDFTIIECEAVCVEGRRIFEGHKNIEFTTTLPDTNIEFDLIHLGSSIQYIHDWRSLLNQIVTYSPPYIVFSDVPAANIKTFATAQKYYESQIPCWFFNEIEFCAAVSNLGYELIFQSLFLGNILGKYDGYPMDNFPDANRIGHSRNYVFRKI